MNSSLRVLVAGAGAVGCTLAARLASGGHEVSVLARGRTLRALAGEGVHLQDRDGSWQARVHAAGHGSAFATPDVLLLCAKAHDLTALAREALPAIGERTLVVPCVNGVPFWYFHGEGGRFDGQPVQAVDPQGALLRLLPMDQVLGSVVFITAETQAPGRVRSGTPHLLMLGELRGGMSERLQVLCTSLDRCGIEARPLERLRDKLWTKLIANLTSNPLSVVSGATLEALYTDPGLQPTVRTVMHEAMLVASAYGARLEIDPVEFLRLGAAMGPVRTSMLQDYTAGRPLELAAIGDAVLELAARYRLPMPATRSLLALVREYAAGRPSSLPLAQAA